MNWTTALVERVEVDAILFDIDGTLVQSTPAVVRSWRTLAHRYDIDVDELLTVCHGRRSQDTIALFLPPALRAEAMAYHEQLELSDLEGVIALPGAVTLLRTLPTGRWAAVTSGSRQLMKARMSSAGLPVPDILIAAEDVEVGKPDPEGYLSAAAALRVASARCLVIEDAPAGLTAGRAARARTVAVVTSHNSDELAEADFVVHDLTAIEVQVHGDSLTVTLRISE